MSNLLSEIQGLVKEGEQTSQTEDRRGKKEFYTKEVDIQILEAFKEHAKQWGSADTRGRQAIAALVAQKVDRTPNSVFYRLTRVLLLAESLEKVEYRSKKAEKVEGSEGVAVEKVEDKKASA